MKISTLRDHRSHHLCHISTVEPDTNKRIPFDDVVWHHQ